MKSPGHSSDYRLNEPLPAGVVVDGSARLLRYRNYPVFSWPWLRGRTLFALVLVTAWASLNGMGIGLLGGPGAGLQVWLHQFWAFMLMTTCGPALATVVRHRPWSRRREGMALAVAVLIGMAISAGVDVWASARVTQALEQVPALASAGSIRPLPSWPKRLRRLSTCLLLPCCMPCLAAAGRCGPGSASVRAGRRCSTTGRWPPSRLKSASPTCT